MASDKAIVTVMTITDAINLKPATEMVKASNARVLIVSKEYRQALDEQAPEAPRVSQELLEASHAASSPT